MTHLSQSSAPMLTQGRLRELLSYDPVTGVFRRRTKTSNVKPGAIAGGRDRKGYIIIRVDCVMYRAHRLAFLYMIGRHPLFEVDHINGRKDDNRWSNLREATAGINAQNHRNARRDSKTGVRGVHWCKKVQKYIAQISLNGKKTMLGQFDEIGAAANAYALARLNLHAGYAPTQGECIAEAHP